VYTLEGGVQAYFEEFGQTEEQRWENQLFVFDSRLAMTPDGRPSSEAGAAAAVLPCYCCGAARAAAPHRNCPNVDCNRLFLVCAACLAKRGGFCCPDCSRASHVRQGLTLVPRSLSAQPALLVVYPCTRVSYKLAASSSLALSAQIPVGWNLSRCRSGGGGTYLGADPVGGLNLSRRRSFDVYRYTVGQGRRPLVPTSALIRIIMCLEPLNSASGPNVTPRSCSN
jgi:hypothetical protein